VKDSDRPKWFKVKDQFLKQCRETTCHYCQVLITDKNRSVDHMTPIAKGGSVFDLNNLALSCKRCNRFKSDYDYNYFVKNREEIITKYYQKIKEQQDRIAENEKFLAINRSKDLKACFLPDVFEPEFEDSLKKFRSDKVSLVRLTPNSLEFNFGETFPDEKEELLKSEVKTLIDIYGKPVKAIKAYVNFEVTEVVFEVNTKFKVLVKLDTKEEKLLSKKEAAQWIRE
jgi:hypothetical protein